MKNKTILYLDDEESNLNVFRATFKKEYNIFITTDPIEAHDIIKNHEVQVVLSDQKMPKVSGTKFLKQVKEYNPDIVSAIVTGYSDVDVVVSAFTESGIYSYITKPWDAYELKIKLDNAFEAYTLRKKNKNLVSELQHSNQILEEKVATRTKELKDSNEVKDNLLTAITKELKSPIKELSDYMQLMLNFDNAVTFENSKKYAKEISNHLMDTKAFMENIFHWSSLQLGNTHSESQQCIINNYINKNIETLRYKALKKRISLTVELPDYNIIINTSHQMIDFIIRCLLHNAIKLTKKNGDISISLHKIDDTKAKILISDSGSSSANNLSEKISKGKPIDLDNDNKEARGLGIGLNVCKGYVEQMRGEMNIFDNTNGGNDVEISLPLIQ